MTKAKEKKCAACSTPFKQYSSLDKYCSYSCKIANDGQTERKTIYKIKPISQKRQIENLKYQVLRTEFLGKPENQICPITNQPTTDIHHKKGRVGSLFLDTTFWIALSREGHRYVEENPEWAKENGYSLNRL